MKTNEIIRMLRKKNNVHQMDLAKMLDINRSVLNRIEQGTRPLRDNELLLIARLFGVSVDYLLNNEQSPKNKENYLDKSKIDLADLINENEITFKGRTIRTNQKLKEKLNNIIDYAIWEYEKDNR